MSVAVAPAVEENAQAWTLDREITTAALAEIDRHHAQHPTCALCGQRTIKLDRFGLCSKISEPHKKWRAETRAEQQATGRRR